jgi:hypothetical protein
MKLFTCMQCTHTVHFDSQSCIRCGAQLAVVPDHLAMLALGTDGSADMQRWSHYLHIVDTLETAWSYGLAIDPRQAGSDALAAEPGFDPYRPADFQMLVSQWVPLSVALNSLNRSMGHDDAYPFALSATVIDKLAFVHRVVHEAAPAA